MRMPSLKKDFAGRSAGTIAIALIFIISFIFLYGFHDHLFFYQENQSLFLFSGDYLLGFTGKPGGILLYAGNFFTQGYFNAIYGSLLLSAVISTFGFILLKINKKLFREGSSSVLLTVIPTCLLLLLHLNFNWPLSHDLGFLLTAVYFYRLSGSVNLTGRILRFGRLPSFLLPGGGFRMDLYGDVYHL